MPNVFQVVELVVLFLTIMSVVGSAIWGVATMRQMTIQLKESVSDLTHSVDKLADRIDDIEQEHATTRERLAALEATKK